MAVQLDSPISSGLYNHLGENVNELKQRITAEVSRGIATGMSFERIAKQISLNMKGTYEKPGGSYAYALRVARTEGHRIQCQASMDACYKAKEKGADVVKQWDATLDGKTRESHARIHREIREIDEKFSNGLMFPGDPSGGPAETINCRCALNQRGRWALEGGFMQYDGFSKEIKAFEDAEAFEEFKKAYFSKENRQYMNYVEKLEERYQTKDFNKLLKSMNEQEYNHFIKLQEKRPQFNGMYRGDDIIKKSNQKSAEYTNAKPKNLTKSVNNSNITSLEIKIGKSVGAKAKNYDIELPNKEIVHLTEGSRITNIETIAGKGRNRQIDEIDILIEEFGGSALEWQKKKGLGYVDYEGESYHAELHWYEEPTAGRHKWKVKPDADGNWFIEDD